ncbi:hypothetical protein UFOVP2_36 [uncultured Caudovirales phage]|uniref:Uncharacterized protein n=1 Tax=uncultured Caudovirales phage TaxID=2100421 RepID=A0A6J5KG08_9CAUD|nr:hypothetical protein UFOVP2_36 [uncultured Caudovirales phage]
MGMPSAVYIKSGDQPRAFAFGNSVAPALTTTSNQSTLPIYKESVYSSFQAVVRGTGAITATATIQVSNDDNTGRGFCPGNDKSFAPGFVVNTTNASATLASPASQFTQAMVGAVIACPGVPVGTTVSSVAAGGVSLTMSANATVTTTTGVQASLFDSLWVATALGTITLSGTTVVTDGFTTAAPWRYVRGVFTNITGTGATASLLMGV